MELMHDARAQTLLQLFLDTIAKSDPKFRHILAIIAEN